MVILLIWFGCSQPLNSMLLTEEESKGGNCPHGGTAISHDLDLNRDRTLNSNKVVEAAAVSRFFRLFS